MNEFATFVVASVVTAMVLVRFWRQIVVFCVVAVVVAVLATAYLVLQEMSRMAGSL